jgi:predicted nucleic acid-binding protein
MYLDTCILIKLLTEEAETSWLEKELRDHPFLTSELALAEVKSALIAKQRAGRITARQRSRAEEALQEMHRGELLQILPLDSSVLHKSLKVMEACHSAVALRTLDALHLASCQIAREFPLCTTDARLHDAARHLHLPVFPPALPLTL